MGVAKNPSSKGQYTHAGYSANGYTESTSEKALGIFQGNGPAGKTRKGPVEDGMSGGPTAVRDEKTGECQVAGVNSESTNVGNGEVGVNYSEVADVLNPT